MIEINNFTFEVKVILGLECTFLVGQSADRIAREAGFWINFYIVWTVTANCKFMSDKFVYLT